MKKIICILLVAMLVLCCAGCGNKETEENIDSSEQTSSSVEEQEESFDSERVMFGYSYAFDFANEARGMSVGFVGEGENYDIAIIEQGVAFNGWETAVADSRSKVASLIYNATGISSWDIEVVSSELVTNPQGIEIFKADVMLLDENDDKVPTLCYYFVNDKNEIFAFVSVKEEGFEDEIKASMDYMAENLKKAE